MRARRGRFVAASMLLFTASLASGLVTALPSGIGGDEGSGDVSIAGCTCHAPEPSNEVQLLLDGVPTIYEPGSEYAWTIQIIGGPDIDSASNTGGFSMKVSDGALAAGVESESDVQNWKSDLTTLSHTTAGAKVADRTWNVIWTAPAEGSGSISIQLVGNSVNGADGNQGDAWNRLTGVMVEGVDDGNHRLLFAGDGNVEPPAPESGHVDLHHMGAAFRAHWLGLLGFGAVILVLLFCGFFLRYGFSRHYEGRSNLLRLRIKHLRRGDQL